jgi:hypothetical protein
MEGGGSGSCAQPTYTVSQYRTLGAVLEQARPVWLSCCRLTYTAGDFTSNCSHTHIISFLNSPAECGAQ